MIDKKPDIIADEAHGIIKKMIPLALGIPVALWIIFKGLPLYNEWVGVKQQVQRNSRVIEKYFDQQPNKKLKEALTKKD